MHNRFRIVVLALGAVAVGAAAAGCDGPVTTDSVSYTVSGSSVQTLLVKTKGGGISVVPTDQSTISVTESYHYSGNRPHTSHSTQAGELSLVATGCGDQLPGSTCQVDYQISAPKWLALQLSSDDADITVQGWHGSIDASSDAGAVRLDALTSTEVRMHSSGGSVSAGFDAAPSSVNATSNGADVSLTLPNQVYAVDASSDGGSSNVTVRTASDSARRITARSDGGNVTIAPIG